MVDFPFNNWQLQRTNVRHLKKNRYISSIKINSEWSFVCLFTQNEPYRPEILEISRNSKDKEILVSGTVKLMRGSEYLLQRKFVQLIEAGFATTQLELEYYCSSHFYYGSGYSMSGTLTIPVGELQKFFKGIQLESLQSLSSDLSCLLDAEATHFSDIKLECEAVTFSAHKSILCARSPVFAVMLTTEMREKTENKVVIEDISSCILDIMLKYIYTGQTGDLCFQTACELLFAADKYQLLDLKRVCSEYLKGCVTIQNVFNTLELGYLHDQDLKVFALNFICNSSEDFEVMEKTLKWWNLREKRPDLAMDVLISLVKSKDKKLKERKK